VDLGGQEATLGRRFLGQRLRRLRLVDGWDIWRLLVTLFW
jgi:hypothetical protein